MIELCYFSLDQWEIRIHLLWGKSYNISLHCDPQLNQTKWLIFNDLLPLTIPGVLDQFCVLGDILPDSFCLETTTENLVKGKNVKRFRGQLNQQSNRKWSVRPGKLSLFLPLQQRFLLPKEEDFFYLWGRISCNLTFPTTTEGSGFNEKSKDQMLQAVVQSS